MDFLGMFHDDKGLFALLPQFLMDFWYIFVIGLLMVLRLIISFKRSAKGDKPSYGHSSFYWMETFAGLLIVAISIFGIRGGFQLRPIGIITASEYIGPDMAPALLNTPFTLIKSTGKQQLKDYQFYNDKELKDIYSPIHQAQNKGDFRPLNVVVIIMESLSKEHIGALNQDLTNYQGFTPFLDSLIPHSLVCTQAYANGKKSMDGIPAIIAGFPNLMESSFNSSIYSSNKLTSLASILKTKNYQTGFFHGGNNGTMGFDQLTKSVGYEAYYGRDEYSNEDDFDGKWGIFDEPYFQYFADQITSFQQPFMATLFSVSAHHPYKIPKAHKGKFRKGELPIQECIMYSDYALQQFFDYAKTQAWYDNTLFVITADHCSEIALGAYNNDWGKYAIPIIYYMPKDSLRGDYEYTTQQIDIMPSILDYLNYDKDYFALGNSIFDSSGIPFSVSYLNYQYQLIHGNQILKSDLKETYNVDNLPGNFILKDMQPEGLEHFLKAFVQTYNSRMKENRMLITDRDKENH